MTSTVHLLETFIRAPRERVWEALVAPDLTQRYFLGARIESTFGEGAGYRYVSVEGAAIADGTIEVFAPPERLVMTFRSLHDAAMAEEPPSRVEWTLAPANEDGSVTRVRIRHGDLALSPRTWLHLRDRWSPVVSGLKSLLETGDGLPPVGADQPGVAGEGPSGSADDPGAVDGGWHRAQAIAANNSTWELLDGRELDLDAADDLLERAYAAAYHWRRATGSTTVNRTRASWLVSRAHVTLGQGDLALHHAERAAAHLSAAGTEAADFDRAYAHEARARALACLGLVADAGAARRAASEVVIADPDDRTIFDADLAAGPWFGLGEP